MALNVAKAVSGFVIGDNDEMANWLDPLGQKVQKWLAKVIQDVGQPAHDVKDFLNGTWLGHPLHPAMVTLPLGAWSTAAVLDLVGAKKGADTAIGLGILSSLPTAAAGVAQWHDTYGKVQRTGTLHAVLNTAALGCYIGSLAMRRAGHRTLGATFSTVGLGLVGWSGYLGGELAYTLGVGVNRTAWTPDFDDYQVAMRADAVIEGKLVAGKITVDGETVSLVLLRRGERVLALHGICTHAGGVLAEGKLVDGDCVECPLHASRFDMWDGSVVRSPATAPQPRFETRTRDGNVEVRPASQGPLARSGTLRACSLRERIARGRP